jgi:hypothetical protein
MDIYSKTMEFLHQKLLLARTKDQEDRIVNLMYAEVKSFQEKNKHINFQDMNQESS